MNDNRSQCNLPVEYESIGRPSINLANSATTASFTIIKKNNIYNNEVKSFEYILSLSANSHGFNTFSLAMDIEDTLKLAIVINKLRARQRISESENVTIAARGERNFTLQFNTSGTADTIAKAYFNLSKSKAFYLPISSYSISIIYAKCIELFSLNHGCSPQDLLIYYPVLAINKDK